MATTASADPRRAGSRLRRAHRRQPGLRPARRQTEPDHRRSFLGRRAGSRRHADGDAARQHPWRNVVTRALSGAEDPEIDMVEIKPSKADRSCCVPTVCSVVAPHDTIGRSWATKKRRSTLSAERSSTPRTRAEVRQHHSADHHRDRSMLRNLARSPLPGPDPEPRGARVEGAVPRFGAGFLLVLRQPPPAPAGLLASSSRTSCGPKSVSSRTRVSLLRHSALDLVLVVAHGVFRRLDLRREPDQEVLFPAEVLPIVTVLSNMVHFFFGLPILVASCLYQRP